MPRTLFPLAILLLLIPSAPIPAVGEFFCNGSLYTASDPFAASLAYVLSDLVSGGVATPGQYYYSISPYPIAFAYGHSFCSGVVAAGNCSNCLEAAVGELRTNCPMKKGARDALGGCVIRYEKFPFV